MKVDDPLDAARQLIDRASAITVLTGAGISTDSGIPDFRGPNGLWTKNPGAEKTATLQHYVGDPEVRKRAWANRVGAVGTSYASASPNEGHRALVALEARGKLHTLVTQNVDGLHLAAGSDPARVVEIHGTVADVECLDCGERAPMERALARVRAGEEDPPCRTCGGILKSATISFGQNLKERDLMRAEAAAHACDLVLAVGTTLGVYPAAGIVPVALRHGAALVIVNGEPTEMDHLADVIVRASISDALPVICGSAAPDGGVGET